MLQRFFSNQILIYNRLQRKFFVFNVSFFDDIFHIAVDISLIFLIKFTDDNGFTILDNNVSRFDKRNVIFENVTRVVDYHRNNGTS